MIGVAWRSGYGSRGTMACLSDRNMGVSKGWLRTTSGRVSALRWRIIRDVRLARMWDTLKRVRATVKGTYGDESSEYELVGGTRLSQRRRPARGTRMSQRRRPGACRRR
jgi:hypothetical protein